jgi:AhpD family alkylhydroperoxidase
MVGESFHRSRTMLIQPVSADTASAAQRVVLDSVRQRFGRDLPLAGVMVHHEAVTAAMGAFEAAIHRADRLPARLAHLVNLKVAALLGCSFCIDIGSHLARQSGVTAAAVADLPRFRDSDAFSAPERAALAAAEAMTVGTGDLDAPTQAALQSHFDDAQRVELLAVIAWENYRSRFNRAAGLEAVGFCPVTERAVPERASGSNS